MKRDLSIETKQLRRLFKGVRGRRRCRTGECWPSDWGGRSFRPPRPQRCRQDNPDQILATLLLPTSGEAYVKGLDTLKSTSQESGG